VLQAGVLVTFGGCHLLDGLEACGLHVTCPELVRCSKGDCIIEGDCAHPTGDHEEQL
jgi:hypothetical protein